ncbi:MAG: hypothetical protein SHS37scaffold220_65 [Phage 67_12]|nr:MAG: hypothetical protein SHS37scaffold220_65 [Phage 67_12]
MNRNFDAPMLSLDGKPYTDGATLKTVVFSAIQAQVPHDEKMTVDQKMKLYVLAGKVAKGGVVEVTAEDLSLMKERVGLVYPPLTMGEAFRLLEQDHVAPAQSDATEASN